MPADDVVHSFACQSARQCCSLTCEGRVGGGKHDGLWQQEYALLATNAGQRTRRARGASCKLSAAGGIGPAGRQGAAARVVGCKGQLLRYSTAGGSCSGCQQAWATQVLDAGPMHRPHASCLQVRVVQRPSEAEPSRLRSNPAANVQPKRRVDVRPPNSPLETGRSETALPGWPRARWGTGRSGPARL